MYNNEIGRNFKKYRLKNNLSLKEASLLLNIDISTIKKYENGYIIPNSTIIIKFANAYKVKVIDLLQLD